MFTRGVGEGWSEVSLYRNIVRGVARSFSMLDEEGRRELLSVRPELTGTKWDAAVAAAVAHTAGVYGYPARNGLRSRSGSSPSRCTC